MGSHYFLTCRTDERFTSESELPLVSGGSKVVVRDWDQRRSVDVWGPREDDDEFVFQAVERFIDTLPIDVIKVQLSEDGSLSSTSSDSVDDPSYVPFYPTRTNFPRHLTTVRRRELTEVDRLGLQVDMVTYKPRQGETRKVVFKYNITEKNVSLFWHEVNCVMRMPTHPNIVPFDALVVDAVDGVDRVVGFTTVYIPGETLHVNKDRLFKLKYLEQLIKTVDFLNLNLGIVHGDICPWNLLIDPETDSIQVFDFNSGAKLGWDGDSDHRRAFRYDKHRNDVKFVVFTLYEIITREFCFRQEFYPHELDQSKIMRKQRWEKHNNVRLDGPVEDFRRILSNWVRERAKSDTLINHYAKAAEPLDWPQLHVPPEMVVDSRFPVNGILRSSLISSGKGFLKWERPPSRALPLAKGQRLLATGEVVQDDVGSGTTV